MTHIAIDAGAPLAMTIDAPAHGLIDLAFHLMRVSNVAVTHDALYAFANVCLMREEHIGLSFKPVDPPPGWLLFLLRKRRELFDLG